MNIEHKLEIESENSLPCLCDVCVCVVLEIAIQWEGLVVDQFDACWAVVARAQNEAKAGCVVLGISVAAACDVGAVDQLKQLDEHGRLGCLALVEGDIVARLGLGHQRHIGRLIDVRVERCGAARVRGVDAQRRVVRQQTHAERQAGFRIAKGITCHFEPMAE